jgi:hypothetical protein
MTEGIGEQIKSRSFYLVNTEGETKWINTVS